MFSKVAKCYTILSAMHQSLEGFSLSNIIMTMIMIVLEIITPTLLILYFLELCFIFVHQGAIWLKEMSLEYTLPTT